MCVRHAEKWIIMLDWSQYDWAEGWGRFSSNRFCFLRNDCLCPARVLCSFVYLVRNFVNFSHVHFAKAGKTAHPPSVSFRGESKQKADKRIGTRNMISFMSHVDKDWYNFQTQENLSARFRSVSVWIFWSLNAARTWIWYISKNIHSIRISTVIMSFRFVYLFNLYAIWLWSYIYHSHHCFRCACVCVVSMMALDIFNEMCDIYVESFTIQQSLETTCNFWKFATAHSHTRMR